VPARASTEATLILLLVGTAQRRSTHECEIRELAARVDHGRLTALLRAQSLLALVGTRLQELDGERLPAAFADAVRADRDANRRRGSVQAMLALRWAEHLEAAGIACLPIKGGLLGERIHGDVGMRASGDVDLLVFPEHLPEAVEILRSEGFAAPTDRVSKRGLPELHFRLDHPGGKLARVELHWRVHWYEETFSRALLERSELCAGGYRAALAADELAALLLFFARDAFMGLRLASDIAAWWDLLGRDLPRDALRTISLQHPQVSYALATAVSVADRLVGLPSAELLDEATALRSRSRASARLANWNLTGSRGRKVTNYYLVDWLLSPPGEGGSALRRQMLREARPRSGVLRAVEQVRLVLRPPTRLVKSLHGLWAIRGGRDFSPHIETWDESPGEPAAKASP
jgi:hypothetical protein